MGTRRLINIYLASDEPLSRPTLTSDSWLLAAISTYKERPVLAFMDDEHGVPDVGRLFSQILPKDDGTFQLELGVSLPDWLPDMGAAQEYVLDVIDNDGTPRRIAVSNQMTKVAYLADGEQYHAILPKSMLWSLYGSAHLQVSPEAPVVPVRTVVSARFQVVGRDAHEAIEANVEDCIDKLIECLNRIAIANLTVVEGTFPSFLSPNYDRSTFDSVYLMLGGKDPTELANWRLGTSFKRAMWRPPVRLDDEKAAQVRAVLSGSSEIDDIRKMLQMSRSYTEGGLLEFALLQLVIAAEVATSRFVHRMMVASGVSSTKLREAKNDLTFSMMLNLNVMALAPPNMKPDAALLGKINDARKRRNDLMHEGAFRCSKEYLRELHQVVRAYVDYLDGVLDSKSLGATTGATPSA